MTADAAPVLPDRPDRLSALLANFPLTLRPAPADRANLAVLCCPHTGAGHSLVYAPRQAVRLSLKETQAVRLSLEKTQAVRLSCEETQADRLSGPGPQPVLLAEVIWGGTPAGGDSPVVRSFPDQMTLDIRTDPEMQALIQVVAAEAITHRCGGAAVLDGLGAVLLIRMLRQQVADRRISFGLLGALSDPRLLRAVVAVHETPERGWRNEDLAAVAGLSLSRFTDRFTTVMGEPPAAYLRRWRMALAERDLSRGDRVQTVARRYGYASAEAFTRAYQRHTGTNPGQVRTGSREQGPPRQTAV